MSAELVMQVERLLAEGRGEVWGGVPVLPLVDLESGMRFGFDANGTWVALTPGSEVPERFAPGTERRFAELLETPRADFEQQLEARAKAFGLPADALLVGLPSVELVRAVLEAHASHFTRLALLWLLPSELRALRTEIAAVAVDSRMPRFVKDIAQRLIVPE